ncbi:XrtX-associated membrane protein [Hymenobacter psychrophilus]|uniref:Uncharacterized protein n=1 Tax=Hymenobacter psychrophilus TaxID=651662 RepID=A0A1H3LWK5_9BACT|nr:hypothetical protein [Hymenobacter psychrophilus]SDY68404.1 hypothetical protein SAMN04488069_111153 [Hymenobacter psychrophilus]
MVSQKSGDRPAPVGPPRRSPGRLLVAGALGLGLFALGQFDAWVFAGLTSGWQAVLGGLSPTAQRLGQPSGLSTHGVLVGLSYRLLYIGVSLGLLQVLLRGRHSRALALGYGLALALSVGLLLLGQRAGWTWATGQGHRLLDLVSSPLALLLLYGLVLLGRGQPASKAG